MASGWDPFSELQRQVNRLLNDIEPAGARRLGRVFPAVNLYDRGDAFVVVAEVPGATSDDVEVSLAGDTLHLRGERRRPDGVSDDSYRRQERWFGRWARTVTLPERVVADQVTAECVNGRLTVALPKSDSTQPRRILVASPPRQGV